jgi:hypothetical protein
MGEKKTGECCHGPNIQLKHEGSWHNTSLATYVQVAESKDETKERACTVAETVVTFLTTTQGEGGDEYCPFKEIFFTYELPGLPYHWNAELSMTIGGIEIEIGTARYLDK